MERQKLKDLTAWKNSRSRKPLILRGARQVGKTWLMKEFGKRAYEKQVYVNFEKSTHLASLFEEDLDVKRILFALQVESGVEIEPENTLIILDEIQEAPRAITALKYFHEEAPEYHVITAGSLLGMAIHAGISFPVGNVEIMDLHPMTFPEFLRAVGEDHLAELLNTDDWPLITTFRSKYTGWLRYYYFTGGMPEAVLTFSESRNPEKVRQVQKQILDTYELDFSKHAPAGILPRIRMVWNSVPAQLAKENRKFLYGVVKKGSRAKDYELALSWMVDCRQVSKVYRVTKPALPLAAYEDRHAFKLFLTDVGLLAAMADMDLRALLEGNTVFSEFKGALTEQYVFQQLQSDGRFVIRYWSAERAAAEVDFVLQYKDLVVPLEVKAEENLRSKSLRVYYDKFSPPVVLRTSMSDYREQEWLVNVPLYAVTRLAEVTEQFF